MPKVIIVNIPMMYHCILHVQSMSLMSAASTFLNLCIAIFVTKAFNLDCLYITYIMTSVMIRVISAAVNISMSARKLFRNDLNFEFSSGLSLVQGIFFISVLNCQISQHFQSTV